MARDRETEKALEILEKYEPGWIDFWQEAADVGLNIVPYAKMLQETKEEKEDQ